MEKVTKLTKNLTVLYAEDEPTLREEMKNILGEIQNGEFAREWILENKANRPAFKASRKHTEEHQIEKVGAKLRGMMSWIKK